MLKKELVAVILSVAGVDFGTENQLMRKTVAQLNDILFVDATFATEQFEKNIYLEDDKNTAISADPIDTDADWEEAEADAWYKAQAEIADDDMNDAEREKFNEIKNFDLARYANFSPMPVTVGRPRTQQQYKLVWALENNYKIKINTEETTDFFSLSAKICKVYSAIAAGTIEKRTDDEIVARIKGTKPQRIMQPAAPRKDIAEAAVTVAQEESKPVVQSSLEAKLQNKGFRAVFANILRGLANRID